MMIEYKYVRENASSIYIGSQGMPVVMNAWNSADARRAESAFASKNAKRARIGIKHFLSVNYQEDTVYGSSIPTTTAGALKGLIANATCAEDFDRSLYFRYITDCTANISGNGVMIVAPGKRGIANLSTFEEFVYSGRRIDGIACAESIDKFRMAARFGEVIGYDESKTYIIVSPQALEDANQAERFNMVSKDIPIVYDKREHMGFKAALRAA